MVLGRRLVNGEFLHTHVGDVWYWCSVGDRNQRGREDQLPAGLQLNKKEPALQCKKSVKTTPERP